MSTSAPGHSRRRLGMAALVLGVVFGDLGTSPLYALHAAFSADNHAVKPTDRTSSASSRSSSVRSP